MHDAYVYFIQPGSVPVVKIGWSTDDLRQRVSNLQVGNHEELRVIGLMPGTKAFEQELHRRFKHLETHGEWFRLEGDLAAFVADLPPAEWKRPPVPWTTQRAVAAELLRRGHSVNRIARLCAMDHKVVKAIRDAGLGGSPAVDAAAMTAELGYLGPVVQRRILEALQ